MRQQFLEHRLEGFESLSFVGMVIQPIFNQFKGKKRLSQAGKESVVHFETAPGEQVLALMLGSFTLKLPNRTQQESECTCDVPA